MFLKSQPALILASTSAYRRELLARLRVPFAVMASGVAEDMQAGEMPQALVTRLARTKAQRIAERHPDSWVIGSDQSAVLAEAGADARILGKPGTAARCIEQLQDCSARTVSFLTAVALVRHDQSALLEFVDTTRVRFRALDLATIERYVEFESPLDCAGGFKCEGLGLALCESIDSIDPSALVGLPLIRLAGALRGVGFQIP